MGFSKSFENGPNPRRMLFWFKMQFQKGIRHGPSKKIDVYQATLKMKTKIYQATLIYREKGLFSP